MFTGGVKPEQTGWRDQQLSERHRLWGVDCPAVDIDLLMVEYDHAKPYAIIEYKHINAKTQHSSHPSYKAIIYLCNSANLPFYGVRYSPGTWTFTVTGLNEIAIRLLDGNQNQIMDENEYIQFLLYTIRPRRLSYAG